MTESLTWYAVLLALGAASLVPAALTFPQTWSAGATLGRPLVLLLWAEGVWLLTALTPVPYGQGTVVASALAVVALSAGVSIARPETFGRVRARWRRVLAGELLFAAVFGALVLVRAQAPAAFGNEKPMEMLLLTAVHHADSMPPEDPWFAGEPVAYYHLGYVAVDLLARLSSVGLGTAFNLALASAGAMAATATAGVAADLAALASRRIVPWLAAGLATVSFLLVAPLQGVLDVAWNHGLGTEGVWARLGVPEFPGPIDTVGYEPGPEWWWWHPTRVIPGTITEFPGFSLLLGDLHPHVLALPFGILALALVARTTVAAEEPPGLLFWRRYPGLLLVTGAVFGGLYMTNAWDVVPYGVVWAGASLLVASRGNGSLMARLTGAAVHVALPALIAVVVALPFAREDSAPVAGIGLVSQGSDPVRFSLVWVPLILPVAAAVLLWRPRIERRVGAAALAIAFAAVSAWVAAATLGGHEDALVARGAGWGVLAVLCLAGSWSAGAAARAQREGAPVRAVVLGLLAVACVLVLATELAYVVEAFHFDTRINTVFKLWYATWVILAVAGAVDLSTAVAQHSPRWTAVAIVPMALLYLASLSYLPFAIASRVSEPQPAGLDALAFHEQFDPDLAAERDWAEANIGSDDILLESVGDQYTYTDVLSATTRSRTLLGWLQHELIWRGRDPRISQRWAVVHWIYLEGATEAALRVARKYGVTYIYLGRAEVDRYGPGILARFDGWPVVFESGATRIVRVPAQDAAATAP